MFGGGEEEIDPTVVAMMTMLKKAGER